MKMESEELDQISGALCSGDGKTGWEVGSQGEQKLGSRQERVRLVVWL